MQRRKILILIEAFLTTLPISWVEAALGPEAIIFIFLTPFFFMFIAWLVMKPVENQKDLIPIAVFFATLPVFFIASFFNPLARLFFDILRTSISAGLTELVVVLFFTVIPSLFFAFIAWFFVKSKKKIERAK